MASQPHVLPGVRHTRPGRFRPRFHYELIICGVAGHALLGMDARRLGGFDDLPQSRLHEEIPKRRVYVHPVRWTSLGLSLIEAMHLGMPVVALATTEVVEAVPAEAGVVSNRLPVLQSALRRLANDRGEARAMGEAARRAALGRYGLRRFLDDWDELLEEVAA